MGPTEELVRVMFRCHEDNAASRYRIALGDGEREITGLSFFVFEYFIYNTLCQIDWPASLDGRLVPLHRSDCRDETGRQRAFFEFIRSRPNVDAARLARCFRPWHILGFCCFIRCYGRFS